MVDRVTLDFDLFSLPTAQHKAGLAGLVMSIEEMRHPQRKNVDDPIPEDELPVLKGPTASSASITLTESSCQRLFDQLYSARIGTVKVKKKWANTEVIETIEKNETDSDGNTKTVTYFVHPNLEPNNPFLARHWFKPPGESERDLYAKLWRDMLFQIPRAKPTTRNPYKETAAGEPCGEGAKMWKELQRFAKDRGKNKLRVTKLSSSLLLGAQDSTAENVGFLERSDYLLLLHFWPLATQIYVPWLLDIDPAHPERSRSEPVGFSLAVPDIQDLKKFCRLYPGMLDELKNTQKPKGYRPKDVCVEVPAQGALDLLTRQAQVVGDKEKKTRISSCLHAVEYLHVAKFGNNVKSLGSGRVSADRFLLGQYEAILGRYRSPLFRTTRLESLFQRHDAGKDHSREHWWRAFDDPLSTYPHELFLAGPRGTVPSIAWAWCDDVRSAFREEEVYPLNLESEIEMNEAAQPPAQDALSSSASEPAPKSIEHLIKQIVQNYVRSTTEKKSGVKFDAIRAEIAQKKAATKSGSEPASESKEKAGFFEQQRKVAEKLFLEFRSRHGEDFQAYFAEVFGSHRQPSLYSAESFQTVCDCLLKRPNDVRTITLLALSAAS